MNKNIFKKHWWQGMIPKGRCKYCNRPIFNLESEWAKIGQCIYCYEAEERGNKRR